MSDPVSVRLPRDPRAGAIARRALEKHLARHLSDQSLADVKIVTAELVNNAFLHGKGAIELRLMLIGDRIRVEVIDEGHDASIRVRDELEGRFGGNGLKLVSLVAAEWGAKRGTSHVWADIPVAG